MPVRGEIRNTLQLGLMAGRATTRDLAHRTGVGVSSAMFTLRNMVVAGEVVRVDTARVPGVKRPVPVYDLADADTSGGGTNWDLITCWAQWPGQAQGANT
jgi:hypothetical protein